MIRIDIW